MEIIFHSAKFAKECQNQALLQQRHGTIRARRLRQRLDDLRAAVNLEVMRTLPGRCHELKGDRAGQVSLDLDHPYRLIFEPANDPLPLKDDGGLDWSQVTIIRVIGVEDTHD